MTLPQYLDLCNYWRRWPPEHELCAMFAYAYTTWDPDEATVDDPAERQRLSLERRWAAGAMNPQQMFEAMGGVLTHNGMRDPNAKPIDPRDMPGVGPFPGAP
jgi:hypothetical protein